MKKLIAVLSCLLLASPVAAAPKPLYNPDAVVKVECSVGSGTAFRIADGVYITANHVAKLGGCKIAGHPVKNLKQDDDVDVAELAGPKGGPVIRTSCRDFIADEDYVAIGYAFGDDDQFVEPLVASPLDEYGYRAFVGEVIPGMSGGPVISMDGKVHGVVNMRWPARSMPLRSTFVCKD